MRLKRPLFIAIMATSNLSGQAENLPTKIEIQNYRG